MSVLAFSFVYKMHVGLQHVKWILLVQEGICYAKFPNIVVLLGSRSEIFVER